MGYVYNDEDNAPMNDDAFGEDVWRKYTVYSGKAEADAVESGEYDENRKAAYEKVRQSIDNALEGLADMLCLTGECRNCDRFRDLAEGFMDVNRMISDEQYRFLEMQCSICGGQGTGKPKDARHEEWVDHYWTDLMEWIEQAGLKYSTCAWCPNVYEVYGKYKDPDDEWKAIEKLCCRCRHFGEE